jgi:hypothetical protein
MINRLSKVGFSIPTPEIAVPQITIVTAAEIIGISMANPTPTRGRMLGALSFDHQQLYFVNECEIEA